MFAMWIQPIGNHGLGIFYMVRFDLGPVLQGQTMLHWLWWVVFSVDTNLHRFSDALDLVWVVYICLLSWWNNLKHKGNFPMIFYSRNSGLSLIRDCSRPNYMHIWPKHNCLSEVIQWSLFVLRKSMILNFSKEKLKLVSVPGQNYLSEII